MKSLHIISNQIVFPVKAFNRFFTTRPALSAKYSKGYLDEWYGKRINPKYEISDSRSRRLRRFEHEVSLAASHDYVGGRKSRKKKDVWAATLNDFISSFVRKGNLKLSEVTKFKKITIVNDNLRSNKRKRVNSNRFGCSDYKYSDEGLSFGRFFPTELNVHVDEHQKYESRRARRAKKSLAQIYTHTYRSHSKKLTTKQRSAQEVSFDVGLKDELEQLINDLQPENLNQSVSLITEPKIQKHVSPSCSIVSWFPPQPDWNPWINSSINNGPFADKSLDQISQYLQELFERQTVNLNFSFLEAIFLGSF